MLSPEYLDHLTDDIVELYNRLDASICRDISRRLVKAGRMTDTAKWQAERLRDAGLLYDEVLAEVSRYAPATEQAIKAMFEEAGLVSTEAEIKEYAKAGLFARPIHMSEESLRILKAGLQKTAGEMKNLTMTTAIATQQAYISACTLVEMQVESGMLDYNTAIRRAVAEASSEGLSVVYPSGHVDKIDVAIRRAGLTGVNQTMGKVSLQYAQEFGCDLMEITAHGGARPEHAVWQGQIVSLSGRKGYLSLDDIGYGTGPGFMGWNCRHNWNPFFEGISTRNYSEEALERLNEKTVEYIGEQISEYEASQIQRRMEREIRATKRQLSAIDEGIKASGDEALTNSLKEDFSKGSQKLKRQKDNLSDLLAQTGRLPDNARTQVQGFGRSPAAKAAWANRKAAAKKNPISDITSDFLSKATPGVGTFTVDSGYKGHANERAVGEWLFQTFGGDVRLVKEVATPGIKNPDYIWNTKAWELKSLASEAGIDSAMRKALKQIEQTPGGVILDFENDIDMALVEEKLLDRLGRGSITDINIILRSKGALAKIIKYKK